MANFECARCHRIFERKQFEDVCPACFVLEEEEFEQIKEYLTLHPGATSSDLVNQLDVSLKSIKRYLRQERLEIIGDNKGFIKCELCGAPVNSGYFCGNCYREGMVMRRREESLALRNIDKPAGKLKSSSGDGMSFGKKSDEKG